MGGPSSTTSNTLPSGVGAYGFYQLKFDKMIKVNGRFSIHVTVFFFILYAFTFLFFVFHVHGTVRRWNKHWSTISKHDLMNDYDRRRTTVAGTADELLSSCLTSQITIVIYWKEANSNMLLFDCVYGKTYSMKNSLFWEIKTFSLSFLYCFFIICVKINYTDMETFFWFVVVVVLNMVKIEQEQRKRDCERSKPTSFRKITQNLSKIVEMLSYETKWHAPLGFKDAWHTP